MSANTTLLASINSKTALIEGFITRFGGEVYPLIEDLITHVARLTTILEGSTLSDPQAVATRRADLCKWVDYEITFSRFRAA